MQFVRTALEGVWEIELEKAADERGWFARTFDAEEFRARGLDPCIAQCSASFNPRKGTLRGMHYQAPPLAEVKLVRCVRGAVFDVAVDLRPESPTYCRWHGVELSASEGRALYISKGLAHGFQTLTDDSEVLYHMSVAYEPSAGRGVRFDDPAFAIEWPGVADGRRIVSQRDASYPDFLP
jgi:dTDP-4-dehydrorhamnose 3,5-epimerase